MYGKYYDAIFQMYKAAAEFLSSNPKFNIRATVEGNFESNHEERRRTSVRKYGGSFHQSQPNAALVFAETEEEVLYFLNDQRFFDWVQKRYHYEVPLKLAAYKQLGMAELNAVKAATLRSYCAISIEIEDAAKETIQFELFDEECPMLAKNFLALLAKPTFNGHPIHRAKVGAFVQGGDLVDGSGMHSEGAIQVSMPDESFTMLHDRAGLLGMANCGQDTNGSQYYITLKELPFMNGKSVVFGRVISGMETVRKVSELPTKNERPLKDVKVHAELQHTYVGKILQHLGVAARSGQDAGIEQ